MTISAKKQIEKLTGLHLSFGKILLALRQSEELTQERFAQKLGVSKQYLSAIENDRKMVSVKQAQKFAKILGQSDKVFIKYVLQDLLYRNQVFYRVDLRKAA